MAYTVGSASVEIVPDFRNAQLRITKFFEGLPDEHKVRIDPDLNPETTRTIERKARDVGDRVGKAINEGAAKNDVAATQQAFRTANAIADGRRRIFDREAADNARRREQQFRDEEREFQRMIKAQITALKAAQRDASREEKIRLQVEIDKRQAILDARTTGGLMARAIHAELRQNAGLITAVVAGAVLAGGPAALAAASGLFVGIGALGAFQSERLRASWLGTFNEIKTAGIADTQVLIPAFDRMAGSLGQSFERIRPMARDAFESLPEQVDILSASVTQAAENAIPGLVRVVQAGKPVMEGLGNLVEDIGQGTTDMLDNITEHAPAAGQSLGYLGGTTRELLPLVGELAGEGAELGTLVIPVLNSALGGTRRIVESLGGSLPTLVAGFMAFRTVQGTGRFITGIAQNLAEASARGGMFSSQLGRAAGVLGKVGAAGAAAGVLVGLFAMSAAEAEQRVNDMTNVLIRGGREAERLTGFIEGSGAAQDLLGGQFEKAQQRAEKYLDSLTPLERAHYDVEIAAKALEQGLGDESTTSEELERLKGDLARASARQAAEEDRLAAATKGVTKAMQEQADTARARVDSEFAYQQGLLDVQDAALKVTEAQDELNAARKDGTPQEIAEAELKVKQALLDSNDALRAQAELAGDRAMGRLPAAMDDTQKAIIGAKASLDELNAMVALGIPLPPELEAWRLKLAGIVNESDGATLAQAQLVAALGEVGASVEAIPGTKAVEIHAPTDELKGRLLDLGFTIEVLPDGDIRVEAKTDEAKGNLGNLSAHLGELNRFIAEPHATLDDGALKAISAIDFGVLRNLQNTVAKPTASLNDFASGPIGLIQGMLANLKDKTVTVTTVHNTVVGPGYNPRAGVNAYAATGGAVEDILAGLNLPRYDGGGATWGRGGPRDDLNLIRVSPGEHVFDATDVALMGGQAGVYAFREMLNAGAFATPAPDIGIRKMVASVPNRASQSAATTPPRAVHLYTPDVPTAIRELKAQEHRDEVLASPW